MAKKKPKQNKMFVLFFVVIGSRIEIIRVMDKHPGYRYATLEVLNIPRISDLDPASRHKSDPDPASKHGLYPDLASQHGPDLDPASQRESFPDLASQLNRIRILPLNMDRIRNMPL